MGVGQCHDLMAVKDQMKPRLVAQMLDPDHPRRATRALHDVFGAQTDCLSARWRAGKKRGGQHVHPRQAKATGDIKACGRFIDLARRAELHKPPLIQHPTWVAIVIASI